MFDRLPEQYFTRILAAAAAARSQDGPGVARFIDLGRGNPDLPPPPHAVEALRAAALEIATPAVHGYPPFDGHRDLRVAIAERYAADHGVELDPDSEVAVVPGTKTGIMLACAAAAGPGDTVLLPDPGYPDYPSGVALAGARAGALPLDADDGWQPDFDAVASPRPAAVFLNYPSNPCAVCEHPGRSSARSAGAASAGRGSCTTSPTASWRSTAAARAACSKPTARASARSSCGRRRRSTGWQAGAWGSRSATPTSSAGSRRC